MKINLSEYLTGNVDPVDISNSKTKKYRDYRLMRYIELALRPFRKVTNFRHRRPDPSLSYDKQLDILEGEIYEYINDISLQSNSNITNTDIETLRAMLSEIKLTNRGREWQSELWDLPIIIEKYVPNKKSDDGTYVDLIKCINLYNNDHFWVVAHDAEWKIDLGQCVRKNAYLDGYWCKTGGTWLTDLRDENEESFLFSIRK